MPSATTEGRASPAPSKGAVSQLSGSACLSNQKQKSQQPAKVLLQQQLPAGGVSVQTCQSHCLAQWAQLISVQPRIYGPVHVHGFWMKAIHVLPFPRHTARNLRNRDPNNWGFEPAVSCRSCILETQFYTSLLQKHCKSCKKSGPRNQSSSGDAVKPIKERSSPCVILRGKSSTQGNHCQCRKKQFKSSETVTGRFFKDMP